MRTKKDKYIEDISVGVAAILVTLGNCRDDILSTACFRSYHANETDSKFWQFFAQGRRQWLDENTDGGYCNNVDEAIFARTNIDGPERQGPRYMGKGYRAGRQGKNIKEGVKILKNLNLRFAGPVAEVAQPVVALNPVAFFTAMSPEIDRGFWTGYQLGLAGGELEEVTTWETKRADTVYEEYYARIIHSAGYLAAINGLSLSGAIEKLHAVHVRMAKHRVGAVGGSRLTDSKVLAAKVNAFKNPEERAAVPREIKKGTRLVTE